MSHINIRIKKLRNGAVMPYKATDGDAGYDLYTTDDLYVKGGITDGYRFVIPLGFAIELPKPPLYLRLLGLANWHYCAKVRPRSGFSSKGFEVTYQKPEYDEKGKLKSKTYRQDMDVLEGLIDEPYRDECGVIIVNRGESCFIPKGTRIAQMTIERAYDVAFEWSKCLSETERKGGFGHSGTR